MSPLAPIEGMAVAGKTYAELDKKLRDRFDAFVLCVGEITNATAESIKKLFSRLQMGVSLNPSELRNAMEGPLVYWVDAIRQVARVSLPEKFLRIEANGKTTLPMRVRWLHIRAQVTSRRLILKK